MRVLHVIAAVAPRYGGPSTAVLGACHALRALGLEPFLATTDADGPRRLPVRLDAPTSFHGVPAIFFPRQWSEALKYSRPLGRWLEAHVGEFDVVHVHGIFSHACLAAGRSARRRGVPYVVRPLGMLDPWSLARRRLAKRALWTLGVGRLLGGAAAVHYTSTGEQRLAERTPGLARGVVIPLGVDDSFVAAARVEPRAGAAGRGAEPYVLSLSRLHPKKGLELLVDAFLDVTRDPALRHWRLVVAGDGDPRYVARLRERAGGGDACVQLVGWLDGEAKRAWLAGASLLALPSYQENFGLAAVEALACGVPVLLSTAVNLADEVCEAGAGWVVPLAPGALRDGLRAALRDDRGRATRGAAGRALVVARFTWPRVGAALADLYRSVACRPARAA
jgi:glycosyltransferase involved in cell wall biosynthesis